MTSLQALDWMLSGRIDSTGAVFSTKSSLSSRDLRPPHRRMPSRSTAMKIARLRTMKREDALPFRSSLGLAGVHPQAGDPGYPSMALGRSSSTSFSAAVRPATAFLVGLILAIPYLRPLGGQGCRARPLSGEVPSPRRQQGGQVRWSRMMRVAGPGGCHVVSGRSGSSSRTISK